MKSFRAWVATLLDSPSLAPSVFRRCTAATDSSRRHLPFLVSLHSSFCRQGQSVTWDRGQHVHMPSEAPEARGSAGLFVRSPGSPRQRGGPSLGDGPKGRSGVSPETNRNRAAAARVSDGSVSACGGFGRRHRARRNRPTPPASVLVGDGVWIDCGLKPSRNVRVTQLPGASVRAWPAPALNPVSPAAQTDSAQTR